MNTLGLQLERTSLYLCGLIMSLLAISFWSSHLVASNLEPRFLLGAVLLGLTSLYLRFAITRVESIHRALYRIATIMMFWAGGLYFLPYPKWVLLLLSLPAFFFFYRMEVKQSNTPQEDKIAAGLMLALSAFFYVQQQPMHQVLFPTVSFDRALYYQNAPLAVLIGLGLMRLQHHLHWSGLALIGLLMVFVSSALSGSLALGGAMGPLTIVGLMVGIGHGLLLILVLPSPWRGAVERLCGIDDVLLWRKQVWVLISVVLHGVAVYALAILPLSASWMLIMVAAPLALCYARKRATASLALIEIALLLVFAAYWLFPALQLIWLGSLAALLATVPVLRRWPRTRYLVSNNAFATSLLCYLAVLFGFNVLSPLGLAGLLYPIFCWFALPSRPLDVARIHQPMFWLPISALSVVCIAGDLDQRLLPVWGLVLLAPAILFFVLMAMPAVQSFCHQRAWRFAQRWSQHADRTLALFSVLAVAVCGLSFYLDYPWYRNQWPPLALVASVLTLSAAVFLRLAIGRYSLAIVVTAESMLWLLIGLVRWKLGVMQQLELGGAIDGYLFFAVAGLVAGMRELVRDRAPQFEPYFHRTTLIYSVLGWLYFLVMQFLGDTGMHAEASSVLLALLHYYLARRKSKGHLVFAFVFGNAAIVFFLLHQGLNNLTLYLTPALASTLILAQLFKQELTDYRLKQIRLYCSLLLLGTSCYYNVVEFQVSVWYPVAAAILSTMVVLLGIALRIRIYLYLGVAFFFVNVLAALSHVIISQPPERTTLLIGAVFLAIGVLFTGSYLVFQMKREEILARYRALNVEFARWD